MKQEFTKLVMATLLGIVITGAGSFMLLAQDKVSMEGMEKYVDGKASQIKVDVTRLEAVLDRVAQQTQQLLVEQRVLTEQIRQLKKE